MSTPERESETVVPWNILREITIVGPKEAAKEPGAGELET
jgi:hypothetical protein